MRNWINKFIAPLVVLVFAISACAMFDKSLVVTGESINTVGQQFVATGQAMNRALDAKQVTVEQYRSWAKFAHSFQATYPKLVEGWKVAVRSNDAVKQKEIGQAIVALSTELVQYIQLLFPHES